MRKRRTIAVAILGAVATAVSLLALPAGQAGAASTLVDNAVFNNPNDATGRYAIQNYAIDLINSAPAGSTIRLSTYIFASGAYRDALLGAHSRGVNVQIVADSTNAPSTATTFHQVQNGYNGLAGLGTNKSSSSFAITCASGKGCIGDTGIDHDKFFLFTSTKGATNVVVQTSANMIDHTDAGNSGIGAWNNAVTFVDEPAIYSAYVARFTAMRDQVRTTPYTSVDGNSAKVYFFPRAGDASDPGDLSKNNTVLGVLQNVDCAGKNTTGGYGSTHLTSIHVAMYEFTDTAIAQELWALDNAGCVVHVVRTNVGTDDDAAIAILNNCDAHNGVTIDSIHQYVGDNPANAEVVGFLHSKYLVIDGYYDGSANQRYVWTGSYNYTTSALRHNDEALVKIRGHASIVDAYQSNFQTVAAQSYATVQSGSC